MARSINLGVNGLNREDDDKQEWRKGKEKNTFSVAVIIIINVIKRGY